MWKNALAAFAVFAVFGLTHAASENRAAPGASQGRPPATNYSTNPNASNPKLGGPTYQELLSTCAAIRRDCVESCKPKPAGDAKPGKTICDQPCSGWMKPICENQKAAAGCYSNYGAGNPANAMTEEQKAAVAKMLGAYKPCVPACVYQTNQKCEDIDNDLMQMKAEAKKLKLIP